MKKLLFLFVITVVLLPSSSRAYVIGIEPRFQKIIDRTSNCIAFHYALRDIYTHSDKDKAKYFDNEASYYIAFTAIILIQEEQVKNDEQAFEIILNEADKKSKNLYRILGTRKLNIDSEFDLLERVKKCGSNWREQLEYVKKRLN